MAPIPCWKAKERAGLGADLGNSTSEASERVIEIQSGGISLEERNVEGKGGRGGRGLKNIVFYRYVLTTGPQVVRPG